MAPESTRSSSSTASRRLRGIAQADLEGREAHLGHSCRAWRSGASEAHCLDPEYGCPTLAAQLEEHERPPARTRDGARVRGRRPGRADPRRAREPEARAAPAGERERIVRIGRRRYEGPPARAVREAPVDGDERLARPVALEHEPGHLARAGGVEGVAH